MPISGAMITHLAGSATYLAHLFRVEERPREGVVHWAASSVANAKVRGGYLKKSGGTDGTADSGARSIASFDADVYVRATVRLVGGASGKLAFGLSTSTATPTAANLNFSIQIQSGVAVKVVESNVVVFTHSAAAKPGDQIQVRRVGTTISYFLNRTKIYTSASSSGATLYAATLHYDADTTVEDVAFGFVPTTILVTDHSRKLTYNGEVYTPLPLMPTRLNRTDGLKPNNAELTHILSSGGVSEADIIGGRWDFARYEFIAVNYLDLTMGVAQRMVGRFGQFKINTAGYFTAELRSLVQPMSQDIGDIVGSLCVARQLGDFRCGQPMDNYIFDTTLNSVTNSLTLVLALSPAQADGFFEFGLIRFRGGTNKYYEREIKNNTGNTITLQRPFPFLPLASDAVSVMAGCKRTRAKCKTFVNPANPSGTNMENFQGFPDVPGLSKALRYPE